MKKTRKLSKEEVLDFGSLIDKCEFILIDKKEIKEKLAESYSKREHAHLLMLQSDILLDEIIKELYGEETAKRRSKSAKRN